MTLSRRRLRPLALLVMFSLTTTLTLQKWVGGATIYAPDLEAKRLVLHRAILTNTLPAGVSSWGGMGANGINVRIATVYAAEAIARVTHLPILHVYRLIDTGCLALFFPLLFYFLRRWVRDEYALVGVMYTASILPLTYFLHAFHPWDRPSLLIWLVILQLLVSEHLWAFVIALALSLLIKFDTILVPALFFLIYFRREHPWRTIAATAALFMLTFGTFAGLVVKFPGGASSRHIDVLLRTNLADVQALGVTYPPLLAFLLPVILAVIGFRASDRAARACVVFAIGMTVVFLLQTNFQEVRAELSLLLLILPSALVGLRSVLSDSSDSNFQSTSAEVQVTEAA